MRNARHAPFPVRKDGTDWPEDALWRDKWWDAQTYCHRCVCSVFHPWRVFAESSFGGGAADGALALDHAQGVAAFAGPARLAGHFIHQRPHEIDPTAADTQLAGIEVRHLGDVERFALIVKDHD